MGQYGTNWDKLGQVLIKNLAKSVNRKGENQAAFPESKLKWGKLGHNGTSRDKTGLRLWKDDFSKLKEGK